ncbi:hypothetical protein Y032_0042g636 [Ancylostoma ceylanicum]|uniref:Uncharacterized protein n=1 Tax=Ancylostoma ceylanicum TaxID=53326 RepID=A0A016UGM2_9BILA|nr:hypothetical protein Y032_0042g636 [Ancylostoma ceylanicum]
MHHVPTTEYGCTHSAVATPLRRQPPTPHSSAVAAPPSQPALTVDVVLYILRCQPATRLSTWISPKGTSLPVRPSSYYFLPIVLLYSTDFLHLGTISDNRIASLIAGVFPPSIC